MSEAIEMKDKVQELIEKREEETEEEQFLENLPGVQAGDVFRLTEIESLKLQNLSLQQELLDKQKKALEAKMNDLMLEMFARLGLPGNARIQWNTDLGELRFLGVGEAENKNG